MERLNSLARPAIFAANHQSHLDTPLILAALPARWRYRIAPAMYKEYFAAHFQPHRFPPRTRLSISAQYYLTSLFFNAFPVPQQEAGVPDVLRYAGDAGDLVSDGWSILIYPEGERRPSHQMGEFRAGVGWLASRLKVPVVPVHLEGVDQVMPRGKVVPRFGATQVRFGQPVWLDGGDPGTLAHRLEQTVHAL